jgi:hypothetical protein
MHLFGRGIHKPFACQIFYMDRQNFLSVGIHRNVVFSNTRPTPIPDNILIGRAPVREYGLPLFKAHGRTVHAGPAALVTKKCHFRYPRPFFGTLRKAVVRRTLLRRDGRAYSRRMFLAYMPLFGRGEYKCVAQPPIYLSESKAFDRYSRFFVTKTLKRRERACTVRHRTLERGR